MKTLKKYILLVFLLENTIVSSKFGGFQWPFYAMLAIGSLLLFSEELWKKQSFSECYPLYLWSGIYIVYQFTFGIETLSTHTLIYLVAKVITFVIITVSVVSDWEYNTYILPLFIAAAISAVLLSGISETSNLNSGDRLHLGFGNVNLTGSLGAICFAVVIFFWDKRHTWLFLFAGIIALYSVLASGSRNSLLYLAIMLLLWTRLSLKKIVTVAIILMGLLVVISYLPIQLAGIDHAKATIAGIEGSARDVEREATKIMISERPIEGWGYNAENTGYAAQISKLGSHNGYLDTIKFMGYPFAILWFLILVIAVFPLLKFIRNGDNALCFHLTIVLSTMATAFFEGWFTGVHQINTNIMFYSLAILTTYSSRSKNQ